jgi:hypothetical protein
LIMLALQGSSTAKLLEVARCATGNGRTRVEIANGAVPRLQIQCHDLPIQLAKTSRGRA